MAWASAEEEEDDDDDDDDDDWSAQRAQAFAWEHQTGKMERNYKLIN